MIHLPRTVVIVGAGFSGAVVAINLLRLSYWRPARIVLVERAERMARGAAYAEKAYPYLLNVPAGRMSLNSSDPLEFLKFAQQRVPNATAEDFLPRSLYGEYLETALRDAELASPAHVQLVKIRGDVCSIEHVGSKRSVRVELKDGSSFIADDVVLALGNPPPGHVPGTERLAGSPRYVSDPWSTPRQSTSANTRSRSTRVLGPAPLAGVPADRIPRRTENSSSRLFGRAALLRRRQRVEVTSIGIHPMSASASDQAFDPGGSTPRWPETGDPSVAR